MILICGPCVIDDFESLDNDAKRISAIVDKYRNIEFFFKASCVKNNRTNINNYYGPDFETGIKYLTEIKARYGIKITTDFHTEEQIRKYAHAVDLIQIPAFLAMQTSLVNEAVKIGKDIHIKKPQWLPPYEVHKPISKVKDQNPDIRVFITDRGTTFGYGNVMFDPRHIKLMKQTSQCDKVLVDITHLQNHSPIYHWDDAKEVGSAALAAGADGLFMESTAFPEKAKCDGDCMIPTHELGKYIKHFVGLHEFSQAELLGINEFSKSMDYWEVYNPITLHDMLIRDSAKRPYNQQYIRLDALAPQIKFGSTLLDLGCNAGFFIRELSKLRNIIATGVDNQPNLIELCNMINDFEQLNATFIQADMLKLIQKYRSKKTRFDYVLLTSVFDFDACEAIFPQLLEITNIKVFVEPTNHEGRSKKEMSQIFQEKFGDPYNAKFLTTTDYQNRFLFMVDKNAQNK